MELTNEQKTRIAYNQNLEKISQELLPCAMLLGTMDHVITEDVDVASVASKLTPSGLLQVTRNTHPSNWLAYEPSERMFIDIHEWWHPTLYHFLRRQSRDPLVWNIACDCEINPMVTSKYARPVNALMPKTFGLPNYLNAEEMYERLMNAEPPEIDKLPVSEELKEAMKDAKNKSSHPYGAFEAMYSDRIGNDKDGIAVERIQGERLKKLLETKNPMITKMFGNMAGGLKDIVMSYIYSDTQYTFDEFNNEFGKYHKVTSTKRKNKWGLPWGKITEETRNLWLAIDTSASVSDVSIKKIIGEIEQIFAADPNNKISVFCIDTTIQSVQPFEEIDLNAIEIKGRGGTDFFDIYETAETLEVKHLDLKMDTKPDGIIYLTDGYAQAPDEEEIDTLWVILQDPSHSVRPTNKGKQKIEWGKYIYRD